MTTDNPDALTVEQRLLRLETAVDTAVTSNVLLPDLSSDVRRVREELPRLTAALTRLDQVESRVDRVAHDSRRARRRFGAYCAVLVLVGALVYLSLAVQRSASCDVRNEATLAQAELLQSLPLPAGATEYQRAFTRYLDRVDVVDCAVLRNPLG